MVSKLLASSWLTRRIATVTVSIVIVLASGCIGRRAGSGGIATSATADSLRRDSLVQDSLRKVAAGLGDTALVRAGVTPPIVNPPAADSAKIDSVARAAAALAVRTDSLARADSIKNAKASAKATPATRECILDFTQSPAENGLLYRKFNEQTSATYIGGGFVGFCQGENNRLSADSAEQYTGADVINLFGNVVYEEPGKIRINALRATYFTREQRLFADGGIVATQLETGSTFTGPSIDYFRAVPGVRPSSKLLAPGRPTARLIEKDSTGKPTVPIVITANTMQDEGDSLLYAWGAVSITRNSITSTSDSASYDKTGEKMRLIRQAQVTNDDGKKSFKLVGDTIELYSRERVIERVMSLHNADATNEDFNMKAEKIDMRLVDQKLNRAYAFGKGRATATTTQQELIADSIEIFLPDQRVREVRAVGNAVTTGVPDTLKIKSPERDVLRGDTVIATFDTVTVPADTAQQAKIRKIEAQGNASSLFQIASKQGPQFPPAINYLRASTIVVSFDTGSVKNVVADSGASGLYLEPVPDSLQDTTSRVTPPPRKPPPSGSIPQRPVRQAPPVEYPMAVSNHPFQQRRR